MRSHLQLALLALQAFQVLFIALHDWVPLGRFNDTAAVRRENPGNELLRSTLLSTAPFAIALALCARHGREPYPEGLLWGLAVTYACLFYGELTAWWVPYVFRPDPERAARYRKMFGNTHAFLPERNGIRPNTLHVVLHLVTLATLIVLGILLFAMHQS